MGLIKRLLLPLKIEFDIFHFWYIKRLWGFQNAALQFKVLHKASVIPVLKANGAKIGDNCDIETGLTFHNCKTFCNLIIGNNCHIGKNCFIDLKNKVEIGNNVVISMLVSFITHVDVGSSSHKEEFPSTHLPIIIENNVYIGTGATVLMGVKIEAHAFITAGAIVNNIVETSTMVGGVPAKVIRRLGKR